MPHHFLRKGRRSAIANRLTSALLFCTLIATIAPTRAGSPPRAAAKKPASSVVTVSIQPLATIEHSEVTIGDIATIDGGESTLRSRIAGLDLSDPPEVGKSSKLTRDLVLHRIRIAGIDAKKYRLQGAESVVLTLTGYRVPEKDVINAGRQFLLSRLPWSRDDVTVEPAGGIRGPIQVSGSKENVRFEVTLRAARISLGKIPVEVSVFSQGVKQLDVPLTFDVHLSQTIAVAARQLERGRTLTADDILFEKRIVDTIAGYMKESESPIGQRTKRAIQPLQPITGADVDANESDTAIVIRQRDAVKLVARTGNLTISTMGEALQDGRTGQMIRVRNVDSKTVVSGRVVNRNEVHVLY